MFEGSWFLCLNCPLSRNGNGFDLKFCSIRRHFLTAPFPSIKILPKLEKMIKSSTNLVQMVLETFFVHTLSFHSSSSYGLGYVTYALKNHFRRPKLFQIIAEHPPMVTGFRRYFSLYKQSLVAIGPLQWQKLRISEKKSNFRFISLALIFIKPTNKWFRI